MKTVPMLQHVSVSALDRDKTPIGMFVYGSHVTDDSHSYRTFHVKLAPGVVAHLPLRPLPASAKGSPAWTWNAFERRPSLVEPIVMNGVTYHITDGQLQIEE